MPEFPGYIVRGRVLVHENGCFRRYLVYVAGWHPELGRKAKCITGTLGDIETELTIEGIWPSRTFEVVCVAIAQAA